LKQHDATIYEKEEAGTRVGEGGEKWMVMDNEKEREGKRRERGRAARV